MAELHRIRGLVRRVVVYRDIRLGVAEDALFDGGVRRVVGLDVRCGDGERRFLPLPACEVHGDRVAVDSALVLLEGEIAAYRTGGARFSELAGRPVHANGSELGPLADLVVTAEGEVRGVVATGPDGEREVDPDRDVRLGNLALGPTV